MSDPNKELYNMNEIKLTSEQTDILRELGNIGSGNAITALSELLNSKVEISLTHFDVVQFWKVPTLIEDEHSELFGIISRIKGKNDLILLQLYPKETVLNMINKLSELKKLKIDDIKSIENLSDFSKSIILEVGNILSGHYVSSLANLLSITLIPDVPDLALDNIHAIMDIIPTNYSQKTDYVITIETMLKIEEFEIIGTICFIPSFDTAKRLLKIISDKFNL